MGIQDKVFYTFIGAYSFGLYFTHIKPKFHNTEEFNQRVKRYAIEQGELYMECYNWVKSLDNKKDAYK